MANVSFSLPNPSVELSLPLTLPFSSLSRKTTSYHCVSSPTDAYGPPPPAYGQPQYVQGPPPPSYGQPQFVGPYDQQQQPTVIVQQPAQPTYVVVEERRDPGCSGSECCCIACFAFCCALCLSGN